jgi:hypothetical protein
MTEMVNTTAPEVNAEIDRQITENIRVFASQSDERISHRIKQLDLEWDVERILELNASVLASLGTLLGAFVNPWFLLIPGIVTAFLFQHATQGWCPPLPIFRRMGKRTRNEIDSEKFAMKALRGDFDELRRTADTAFAEQVISAVAAFRR